MLWKSIGFKLIITIVTFSVACVGVFVYLLDRDLRQQYESDVLAQAYGIGNRVSRDIRDGMLLHGDKDTPKSLKNIGYQTNVRKVRILDNKGTIKASTAEVESGKAIAMDDPFCMKCHGNNAPGARAAKVRERGECFSTLDSGERIANVTIGIFNKPDCSTSECHAHPGSDRILGLVDVEVSLKGVDQRLSALRAHDIRFALVLVLGISAIGSLFIYRIIYLPLREIIRGTKNVARGNLDQPISVNRKGDEIGYLARSFNKMTARIKEMTEHLSKMNVELERKVEERTEELKKTQASVMQSEKLASLGLMAAAIAHEINNPLTAVLTYSSLLHRRTEEGTEVKEDLEVIVSETTRCREIVRGLLDFARETEFIQKPININNLLTEITALLSHQVIFQNIEINGNFANYLPDTIMDADQIKQVFLNMMLNAADAMPNGGKLFIRTSFDYEFNLITVEFTDTGIGIPESDLKRIFDPFFTTKAKGKGTGLGLSVSYGIVQRHGGTIDVKSRVGEGATFFISFPVTSAAVRAGGLNED